MQVEITETLKKLLEAMVATGNYASIDEAVNILTLRGIHAVPGDEDTTHETPYEKATRLELIGAAHRLPADLSSNKQYMEGFGQS